MPLFNEPVRLAKHHCTSAVNSGIDCDDSRICFTTSVNHGTRFSMNPPLTTKENYY